MYEQILALVFVFLLLGGVAVAFGRRTPGGLWARLSNRRNKGLLSVEDRLVLSPQHSLYLVQMGDRRLLIATHPAGVSFGPEPGGFREILTRAAGENL
ncbi:MAG: flagellar biosynthetic protein FliO [Bryobacteraceae bacterium]|nr:flagellar biosynthetic protein FliO [Solibacteraceae bacterium]MCL4843863.1 flagellar biosynthetic protein FliO [Bryobacteraceae bacterium]MCO5352916.1 flagellar biosynthetic protein FliO [Bryobacteraceae bacterium]HRJ18043.1 flagellar biosynthetic protein FliO [Bryobacteraceae bacterium]